MNRDEPSGSENIGKNASQRTGPVVPLNRIIVALTIAC